MRVSECERIHGSGMQFMAVWVGGKKQLRCAGIVSGVSKSSGSDVQHLASGNLKLMLKLQSGSQLKIKATHIHRHISPPPFSSPLFRRSCQSVRSKRLFEGQPRGLDKVKTAFGSLTMDSEE